MEHGAVALLVLATCVSIVCPQDTSKSLANEEDCGQFSSGTKFNVEKSVGVWTSSSDVDGKSGPVQLTVTKVTREQVDTIRKDLKGYFDGVNWERVNLYVEMKFSNRPDAQTLLLENFKDTGVVRFLPVGISFEKAKAKGPVVTPFFHFRNVGDDELAFKICPDGLEFVAKSKID